MCWCRDFPVPIAMGTEIIRHRAFWRKRRSARRPIRSAFPSRSPQGLQPWQAKKLYIGNVCGFGAMTCPDRGLDTEVEYGREERGIGRWRTYSSRWQGLRHQMSQGAANWTVDPGDRFTFYRLSIRSCLPTLGKDGHEKSFFDGIDTTWPGLAGQLGDGEEKLPDLRSEFTEIAKLVADATAKIKGRRCLDRSCTFDEDRDAH